MRWTSHSSSELISCGLIYKRLSARSVLTMSASKIIPTPPESAWDRNLGCICKERSKFLSRLNLKKGGLEPQVKTINRHPGGRPRGNSSSLLLTISIHQWEMLFTNPHHYAQQPGCKLVTRHGLHESRGSIAHEANRWLRWPPAKPQSSSSPQTQWLPPTQRHKTVKKSR